jgi:hypothetical protein
MVDKNFHLLTDRKQREGQEGTGDEVYNLQWQSPIMTYFLQLLKDQEPLKIAPQLGTKPSTQETVGDISFQTMTLSL